MSVKIGTLTKVELREAWVHEAHHFTPWLAQSENLQRLSEAVGIPLEPEQQEAAVGPFRADILCRNLEDDSWVLVENQLERTDHNHLGQVLTYAAGLKVATIIWIAKTFTDEHRAALDWLNDKTPEGLSFFGVEIELWKIGNSPPAPKFSIVSKPNTFVRRVKESQKAGRQLIPEAHEYWSGVLSCITSCDEVSIDSKPTRLHDIRFSVDWPDIWLKACFSSYNNNAGVWVSMRGPNWKQHYDELYAKREEIEASFGEELNWGENEKNGSAYKTVIDCDPTDRGTWQHQHTYLAKMVVALYKAFDTPIRELD